MKRCPKCDQDFADDYSFCLSDGSTLVSNPSFSEIPTVVIPPPAQASPSPQKGVNPAFIYASVGFFAILLGGAVVAFILYSLNGEKNPAPNSDNSSVVQSADRKETVDSDDDDDLIKQKEELKKREDKLKLEKERLDNEKKDLAANKIIAPASEQTTPASTATIFAPPTNIRETPNGAILCSIKKRTPIEILGSTGVTDNNGLWYYTNACGKTGVVHSTQIRF